MSSIIEKLQKLINHERSAREIGNIAEAEAFTAKIQTILTEHKLTMSEVEFEAQDTVDPIDVDTVDLPGKSTPTWQLYLSQGIARNFFCCVIGTVGENRQTFVGRNSDRTAAVEMFRYLVGLAIVLAQQEGENYVNSSKVRDFVELAKTKTRATNAEIMKEIRKLRRTFEASFLLGFGAAIMERLDANRKDLEASATTHGSGLMLRDDAAIAKYTNDRFETKRQTRIPNAGHASGFNAGFQRGNETSLKSRTALGVGA